jgi:SAM-dependent methyltransferase
VRKAISQHQTEIERNVISWQGKPLLRQIYDSFYGRILRLIDPGIAGRVVEIGSGIGNLKAHFPATICTDLFPNPWLDMVCDGYELPFTHHSLSHLILFDVFHHLQRPAAVLVEARRALVPSGRLILFEPYISLASLPIYGLFHHEPVAMKSWIDLTSEPPPERGYYAAQGNATRLFFRREVPNWPDGWNVFHAEGFSSFSYLLSGGYSKSAIYPGSFLPLWQRLDRSLSQWPTVWGSRCLIGLQSLPEDD